MTRIPPLLPTETLSRVLRTARVDGLCVVGLASLFALSSAAGGNLPFAAVGLFAAAAGSVELHGRGLLVRGDPNGMNWLVASQPFLLLVIYAYCLLRLQEAQLSGVPESVQSLFAASAAQFGMTAEQYLGKVNRLTVQILAAVATICQGGMALYYWRRRAAVERALRDA